MVRFGGAMYLAHPARHSELIILATFSLSHQLNQREWRIERLFPLHFISSDLFIKRIIQYHEWFWFEIHTICGNAQNWNWNFSLSWPFLSINLAMSQLIKNIHQLKISISIFSTTNDFSHEIRGRFFDKYYFRPMQWNNLLTFHRRFPPLCCAKMQWKLWASMKFEVRCTSADSHSIRIFRNFYGNFRKSQNIYSVSNMPWIWSIHGITVIFFSAIFLHLMDTQTFNRFTRWPKHVRCVRSPQFEWEKCSSYLNNVKLQ